MRRWWSFGTAARRMIAVCALAVAVLAAGIVNKIALDRYAAGRQAHAISERQYESVPIGHSQERVLADFGAPEEGAPFSSDACVTYKERGAALLREKTFRFCFRNGKVLLKDVAPIEDPDLVYESPAEAAAR